MSVESSKTAETFEICTASVRYLVLGGEQEDSLAGWQAAVRQALRPGQPQAEAASLEASDSAEVSQIYWSKVRLD